MSERVCGGIGVGHRIVFYDGCIYVYVEVEAASLLYTSPVESFVVIGRIAPGNS